MADDAVHVQLRCSNCGRVVATIPQSYRLDEELVCPGCGARVKPPGVIGKMTGDLKNALADASDRKKEPPEGTGADRNPDTPEA